MKKRADRGLLPAAGTDRAKPAKENLEDLLRVEPLSIEVGVGLISFIADGANSPLLRRIAQHPQTAGRRSWDSSFPPCG